MYLFYDCLLLFRAKQRSVFGFPLTQAFADNDTYIYFLVVIAFYILTLWQVALKLAFAIM